MVPRRALALLALVLVAAVCAAPSVRADTGDVAADAGLQWGLARIGAEDAWARSRGAGVTIAVVDSGVALDHEDLSAQVARGTACQDTGGDPARCDGSAQDDDGHGTHVAGVAAAAAGNGVGIAGVAPEARLLPVKVLFRDCDTCPSSGTAADVAAGIRWATDRGAHVINLSLGSTTSAVFGPGFADAVRYAWNRGAIPVVAAGNEFVLTADFGDSPAVVVSATDREDGAPSYSSGVGDARWAVAAPGGEGGDTATSCSQDGTPLGILSTYWAPDDDAAYACLSGTSMAAPHVSGALAVLLGAGLAPSEAIEVLRSTATDLGPPGRDPLYGSGRIDVAAAVDVVDEVVAARPPVTTPTPPVTIAPTAAGPPVPEVTTTVPALDDDPLEETSAPQPFESPERSLPAAAVGGAVAAIALDAAALGLLARRRRGAVGP